MKLIAAMVVVSLVAGCAAVPRQSHPNAVVLPTGIIIDGKGKDRSAVLSDGEECAQIAQATAPEEKVAAGAVAGAVAGALLGALIYRASGVSGNRGATYGAGLGALSGTGSGAAAAAHDFKTVLRNCMIGRGHVPLN